MYGYSRAIYRALSDEILEDPHAADGHLNHARVLRACEATIERLATDRHHFARPSRTLFGEIRAYFPMSSQLRVLRVIEHFVGRAEEFIRQMPQTGFDINGNPLHCRATTRRGTPCQRVPVHASGYCPSHQHLAATEEMGPPVAA